MPTTLQSGLEPSVPTYYPKSMKNFAFGLIAFSATTIPAQASQELKSLTQCHEALDGRADARTFKLNMEGATPFVLPAGKKLYFVTDESISSLENKYAGQDIVIHLIEQKKDFHRKMTLQKNGSPGSVSFQDPSQNEKEKAITPSAELDEVSLGLLKKEILRQVNSTIGEYQNKYDPQGTIEALSVCKKVSSPELQVSLEKQIAFYEKLARNKKPRGSYQKESSGAK